MILIIQNNFSSTKFVPKAWVLKDRKYHKEQVLELSLALSGIFTLNSSPPWQIVSVKLKKRNVLWHLTFDMLKSSFCNLNTDYFLTICSSFKHIIFTFIVFSLTSLCTHSGCILTNAMISFYFVMWKDVSVNGSKLKYSLKRALILQTCWNGE